MRELGPQRRAGGHRTGSESRPADDDRGGRERRGALQAESTAKAAGDIPDNQVFVVFRNTTERYSLKYPAGWAQSGRAVAVTFRDKNNVIRILVTKGPAPSARQARHDLRTDERREARFRRPVRVGSGRAAVEAHVLHCERSQSGDGQARDAHRRPLLPLARRETGVFDLGTPGGVDNVDAYRLMVESFRWK